MLGAPSFSIRYGSGNLWTVGLRRGSWTQFQHHESKEATSQVPFASQQDSLCESATRLCNCRRLVGTGHCKGSIGSWLRDSRIPAQYGTDGAFYYAADGNSVPAEESGSLASTSRSLMPKLFFGYGATLPRSAGNGLHQQWTRWRATGPFIGSEQ